MPTETNFVEMIKNHEGIIYKITRAYCDSQDDQMDLYQDIVYQLWKGFDNFRGDSKPSTWMYRVALNTAFTFLRKEKKKGYKTSLDHIQLSYEVADNNLDERVQKMYYQIKKLSEVDRGIILLLLEGNTYDEISEITGYTRSKVATRISRIKEKLRAKLTK